MVIWELCSISKQCLSFLMAGKCDGENIPIVLPGHKHVELLDHGGFWRVTSDTAGTFLVAECYFEVPPKNQHPKRLPSYCFWVCDKYNNSDIFSSYSQQALGFN